MHLFFVYSSLRVYFEGEKNKTNSPEHSRSPARDTRRSDTPVERGRGRERARARAREIKRECVREREREKEREREREKEREKERDGEGERETHMTMDNSLDKFAFH
jgi:hypothetical protein